MFTSINPATGETVATHEELDAEGIELALSRAATAFKAWRNSPVERRTALLTAIADQWEANKQHLAEMAVKEKSKDKSGMSGKERRTKCSAEWKEMKAAGKTSALKWPKFYSDCNKRLKGA